MRGVDFAGGRPGAKAIKAAGFDFVVRYLTDGGPGLPGKLLLPAEMDDYKANNVAVCFMWETSADRAKAGRQAGFDDALKADNYLISIGLASQIIYFAVDFDATEVDQTSINEYLAGAGQYLGIWRVGVYGGYWPISRAAEAGVVAWVEQTQAWSGDNLWPSRNITQQIGQITINGIPCDVLEAHTVDFGQFPPPSGERSDVDFSTQWPNKYHDVVDNTAAPMLSIGDQISYAQTWAAEANNNVKQLRLDLPSILADALKNVTVQVTIQGVGVEAKS